MITAAITGGTGFIGRRLIDSLVRDQVAVRALTRKNSGRLQAPLFMVQGDLTDSAFDGRTLVDGAQLLYHCAGNLRDQPGMRSLHVDGTRRLIDAAAGRIRHWIQLSSVGVYGPVRSGVVDEHRPLAPVGEYETTKAEADRLVVEAAANGAFTCTVLRPSIIFGPGMFNQSLYKLISMVAKGWFFFVGAPGASANYVFVDNVVDALMLCGNRPEAQGRTYNLSDYRTMEQFVGAIASALGRTAPTLRLPESIARAAAVSFGRVPGFPLTVSRVDALTSRARYSTAAIERELGYEHGIAIEEGLRQLVDDWRTRR